jgi:beta-barrel assembly-enhancing protease
MKTQSPHGYLSRALVLLCAIAVGAAAPAGQPLDLPDPGGSVDIVRPASRALDLPDIGSSADTAMTSAQERRLGRAFMQSVRKSLPVNDDPLLNDYIVGLGNDLVASSGTGAGNYTFFLIDQPVINAFAGPGGYVGVYAGLVLATQSEGELAAVVAHEIAHVTQRHLMRAIENQSQYTLPTLALLVAAAILGAQVSGDLAAAAITGIQAASIQQQINFTRDNEKEADRVGIVTLSKSGHDPFAMAGFFERLSKESRTQENNAPEFLRTHPVNSNRIADAVGRAEAYGHRQKPDPLRFHLTRADLRQRAFRRADQAVESFRKTLKEGRYANETAEHYGLALALERAGSLEEAAAETRALRAKLPQQAEMVILDARLQRRQGNAEAAIANLREALGLSPTSVPLNMAYADTLMAAGRSADALRALRLVATQRPNDPELYKLMSDAAGKSGEKGETHLYRANYLYLNGDLEPAIKQLENGLRTPGLSYQAASRLQVRLEELKDEQRDLKKEGGLTGPR